MMIDWLIDDEILIATSDCGHQMASTLSSFWTELLCNMIKSHISSSYKQILSSPAVISCGGEN